ncbi:F-box/kelch-repeat protein At3g23880-like [Andrographis paniculata]|uniref:F-box/kelch-repeat protein At3g23880-like n=1 Tax=Andrographis paniculata TaxID=175694 RepID=UPI0021E8DB7D|nr:F-box/kelch-repeat protein At3g23880-like [Andrographis paniculata]XP_051133071.1 F-box/kelch-repeat protein At3g23880-like [Andrographis paniculata]XP_051133072.1 F-box/kelch-repeat protein At3g23880-like [Andrographis paniculata]
MGDESGGALHQLSQVFPDEIIVEILARLPVESLLRFKSVSKSWLSLIATPDFMKQHHKTAAHNGEYSCLRLIGIFEHPHNHFREYSLHSMLHEPEVDPLIMDYSGDDDNLPMRIVGSCQGIICIAFGMEHFVLWNPSIKKYNYVPSIAESLSGYGCYVKDGFGYVESTDDFKIVAIFYCMFIDGPYTVHIYSLKTNEWRNIEGFSIGTPLDDSGKYACGKIHWLVDCDGSLDIVSLDLITESYARLGAPPNEATQPAVSRGCDGTCVTLGLFSGLLCVLYDDHRSRMDLWVMNEYGVTSSWSKLFVLPHLGAPGYFPHMLRIWKLNDGNIFLSYGTAVAVYNPRIRGWAAPQINDVGSIYQADFYVESLVSPCNDDDDDDDDPDDAEMFEEMGL